MQSVQPEYLDRKEIDRTFFDRYIYHSRSDEDKLVTKHFYEFFENVLTEYMISSRPLFERSNSKSRASVRPLPRHFHVIS